MGSAGRELTVFARELTESADVITPPIAPTAKFQVTNPPIVKISFSELPLSRSPLAPTSWSLVSLGFQVLAPAERELGKLGSYLSPSLETKNMRIM